MSNELTNLNDLINLGVATGNDMRVLIKGLNSISCAGEKDNCLALIQRNIDEMEEIKTIPDKLTGKEAFKRSQRVLELTQEITKTTKEYGLLLKSKQ